MTAVVSKSTLVMEDEATVRVAGRLLCLGGGKTCQVEAGQLEKVREYLSKHHPGFELCSMKTEGAHEAWLVGKPEELPKHQRTKPRMMHSWARG